VSRKAPAAAQDERSAGASSQEPSDTKKPATGQARKRKAKGPSWPTTASSRIARN